ncbi:bifunctional oligoribonuclease/PAP phosphatase NrnA [candidate division KSB1 bacterium]|nr:bifunctional oligoribonuclease/PAP phosphatase NrnA [candidate division KSB1 bacterium]RQV99929.1 MAG: bifunctional oligoribonuclease/PAP phosphatase NrnA [candidate division KSB1 bacterium]
MEHRWSPFRQFLANKSTILITTHLNPDGDALGSELALAHYLREVGKRVFIINSDPLPHFLHFLTDDVHIEQFSGERHAGIIDHCDGCIVVDVSEWKRLGEISTLIKARALPIACIDHHLSAGKLGDIQVLDEYASSTGELIYDFLKTVKANFSQSVVDALYTCILTDTGSFKFSNTTAQTHFIAANLLGMGAHFERIYAELYESDSKSRTLLKGHLLADMKFECDDRFVWFVLSQELLKKTGAHLWEAEGFSDLARPIKGVEMSIMFSESKDGLCKASFRSKGKIPIHKLAEHFGGGGHKYAAGASLEWPLREAIEKVITAAKSYFDQYSCSMI